MAWFGEGFSSLKGQLTNFAKGVLVEDGENETGDERPKTSQQTTSSSSHINGAPIKADEAQKQAVPSSNAEWDQALQSADKFLGQDGTADPLTPWPNSTGPSTSSKNEKIVSNKTNLEKDVAAMLPRGLANFFHISGNEQNKNQEASKSEPQTESNSEKELRNQVRSLQEANQMLSNQNANLSAEVATLSRMVQDLESQVAFSQDENANLSTGLEELDIQHQQAIERILVDKDEAQKQYEILKTEYKELRDSYDEIVKMKEKIKNVSPLPSITEEDFDCEPESTSGSGGSRSLDHPSSPNDKKYENLLKELRERDEELQTVEGENANLRSTVKELSARLEKFTENLPPIPELEGEEVELMEQRLVSLEREVTALREVRTNLETEIETYRRGQGNGNRLGTFGEHQDAITTNQENLEAERERLLRQLTTLQEAQSATETEKVNLTAKIQNLNATVDTLLQENENLKVCLDKESKQLETNLERSTTDEEFVSPEMSEYSQNATDHSMSEGQNSFGRKKVNKSSQHEGSAGEEGLVKKYELEMLKLMESLQSAREAVKILTEENETLKIHLERNVNSEQVCLTAGGSEVVNGIGGKMLSADNLQDHQNSVEPIVQENEDAKIHQDPVERKSKLLTQGIHDGTDLSNESTDKDYESKIPELADYQQETIKSLIQENENLKILIDKEAEKSSYLIKEVEEMNAVLGEREDVVKKYESELADMMDKLEAFQFSINSLTQENECLKTQFLEKMAGKSAEIDNLQASFETLRKENEKLKMDSEKRSDVELEESKKRLCADDLIKEVESLKHALEVSKEDCLNLKKHCVEIEEQLHKSQLTLEKSVETKKCFEKEVEGLKMLLEQKEEEGVLRSKSLAQEIEELKIQLHEETISKQSENEILVRKLNKLRSQLQDLDSQLADAQRECTAKDHKMCEILLESTAVEDEYKNYKEESEKKIKLLMDECGALNQKISDQTLDYVKLSEKEGVIASLESRVRELENELNKEGEESLQRRIGILENDLDNVTEEFEISKDLFRQKEIEFKNQMQAREDEVNRLKCGEGMAREKWARSEHELEELRQNEAELVKRSEELAHELRDKDHRLNNLEEVNGELERKLDELSGELNQTRIRLEETTTALGEAEKRLTEAVAQCRHLEAEKLELSAALQVKQMECSGLHSEIQGLNAALVAERTELQKLIVDKVEYNNRYEQLQHLLKEKTGQLEQIECSRDKEVGTLNQEVESLRNQLEYASQLLRVVDRQEAEGQPAVDNTAQKLCPNGCAETQEELNKITTILLNEQTTNKILRNQIDELAEKLSKSEGKLVTLKQHLVEVEENYSGELMVAREKVADLQARLVHADERVRSSSTAYTSASIRANQQVESLTLQVKSLNEQKEKLEAELSKAEDSVQRQVAAVTNLQAVLHQFQRDKQKDIDFETERIRQVLNESNSKNQELASEIRQLGEQLNEAKKGLAAATRLSEQLDKKSEIIASLKKQVHAAPFTTQHVRMMNTESLVMGVPEFSELTETLKLEEDKVKAAYTNVEGKVDRCLVKNLIVGYLSAPAKNREQVIRVIATVLDLNKEERQKVGLEPATTQQQQSLSEAFIRFLETESQPKPQLLLPLAQPQAERPRSRKTSQASSTGSLLLADELPSLPHFTSVGRSPGSILKDVLKDRNT